MPTSFYLDNLKSQILNTLFTFVYAGTPSLSDVRQFVHMFMSGGQFPDVSLSCSQAPAAGPYSEPSK